MRDKIQKILERELEKLDKLSYLSLEPLSSQDVKSLDVLIKAYRSFVEPALPPPSSGSAPNAESDPSRLSEEDLILGLTPTAT